LVEREPALGAFTEPRQPGAALPERQQSRINAVGISRSKATQAGRRRPSSKQLVAERAPGVIERDTLTHDMALRHHRRR
jgi:hypothetical protein